MKTKKVTDDQGVFIIGKGCVDHIFTGMISAKVSVNGKKVHSALNFHGMEEKFKERWVKSSKVNIISVLDVRKEN